MAILNIVRADSRAGRKLRERLRRRGETLLDERFLADARRLVEGVKKGGDRALLRAVRKHDGADVRAIEELRLIAAGDLDDLPAGFESALERAIAAVERRYAGWGSTSPGGGPPIPRPR